MTKLYRTILFLVLAGYGWYYNTALNVVPPAGEDHVHSQLGHSRTGVTRGAGK
ncbi:hypothetical protein ACUXLG_005717 [Ralstonia sp. 121560039-2]|jgi:hypothetical protein